MEENSQGNSNSYKVVLVGESGVGKTSVTSYFLYNSSQQSCPVICIGDQVETSGSAFLFLEIVL